MKPCHACDAPATTCDASGTPYCAKHYRLVGVQAPITTDEGLIERALGRSEREEQRRRLRRWKQQGGKR